VIEQGDHGDEDGERGGLVARDIRNCSQTILEQKDNQKSKITIMVFSQKWGISAE
jgi:hypothetical protein